MSLYPIPPESDSQLVTPDRPSHNGDGCSDRLLFLPWSSWLRYSSARNHHDGTWNEDNSTRHSGLLSDFETRPFKHPEICTTPTSCSRLRKQRGLVRKSGKSFSSRRGISELLNLLSLSCLCSNSAVSMSLVSIFLSSKQELIYSLLLDPNLCRCRFPDH
jgi:hypothetical protein